MATPKEMAEAASELRLFTAAEMLSPENQHLLEQILQLDERRYGVGDADPFGLGLAEGGKVISTHVAALQRGEEVRGAAALILRESYTESVILRGAIEALGDKYSGCREPLQKQVRMLAVTNLVSGYPGTAAALLGEIQQTFEPNLVVGYTRNARFVNALAEALVPKGFSISLGGVPIDAQEPVSPIAYLYEQSVTNWLKDNIPQLKEGASIQLGEGEYPPHAVIYPGFLRSRFTLGRKGIVDGLIERANQLQPQYIDQQQSITYGFTAIHKSIDEIILGNVNG
jgi:hypothetical protein